MIETCEEKQTKISTNYLLYLLRRVAKKTEDVIPTLSRTF